MDQTYARRTSVLNAFLAFAQLALSGLALTHGDIERASVLFLAALLAGIVTVLRQIAKHSDRHPVISAFWRRWHIVVQGLPVMSYVTAMVVPDLVAHRAAFDSRDWVLAGLIAAAVVGLGFNFASAIRQRLP